MKNYLKPVILLFGIFIYLFSCKQDDIENFAEPNSSKYVLKKLQGNEINKNFKLNEKISQLKSSIYQSRYENVTFDINLNYATYIESTDGTYHSYTFYIYNDEDNYNINNIVLSSTGNGEYEADLVTYSLTQQEHLQLYNEGATIDLLSKMSIEPFDINQINSHSRSGTCLELVATGEYEYCSHPDHQSAHVEYGYCTHPSEIYAWQEVDCGGGGGSSGGDGTGTGGTGTGTSGGNNSGGDSTEGGGKATSLTDIDDGPRKNPCQSLNVLTQTDSLSANINPIITELRTKTNLEKEWFCNFRKKMNYGEIYSTAEDGGIKEGKSSARSTAYHETYWFGQVHTHPNGRKPMFSWLDLKAVKEVFKDVHEHFKDDVFLMIVNHDGSVYSLKVTNIDTLTAALETDLTNAAGNTNEKKEESIEEFLKNKYNESTNLEQTFLQLYGNHGISLYEATDGNLTNWKKLELDPTDNETVTETPCN